MGIKRIAALTKLTPEQTNRTEENLPLVWYDVRTLTKNMLREPRNLERMDLFQEGVFGLMYAVMIEETKPDDVRWTTFAHWHIRRAIRRAIEGYNRSIRLPSTVQDEIGLLRRAKDILLQKLKREATSAELAKHLKLSEKRVRDLEKWLGAESTESLDTTQTDTDGNMGADLGLDVFKPYVDDVSDPIVNDALREVWKSSMLSDREREVMGRHVIGDESLEDIGDDLDVTRQRIHQIQTRALKKVREDSRLRRQNDENMFVPNMRTAHMYRFANRDRSDAEWWAENTVKLEWTEERRRAWRYGSIPTSILGF